MTGPRAKIAVVVPALEEGGGVPAVARFIKESALSSGEFELKMISLATSARDACNVRLLDPSSWFRGVSVREAIWEGSPIAHVGAVAGELEFQRYRQRSALKTELLDCDLIQVVSGGASWALSVLGVGKPVVLQVATRTIVDRRRRESIEKGALATWRRLMTRITNKLDDRALRSVDAVLVENQWMLDYVCKIASGRSVLVDYAPPGVDTSAFRPTPGRLQDSRGPGYILSVGRFDDPRKNVDLLLEAFALVRQRMVHAPILRLAGPTNPAPSFWRVVRALGLTGAVQFDVGLQREALIELYQNAMCFGLASDEEGFGVVVVEAMACGVPVVATRCGGPEGIIRDGVDGYLVSRNSAHEMATRLVELATERASNERMGIVARKNAVERFDQEKAGEVYLMTYRRLLDLERTDTHRKCAPTVS